MHIIQTLRFAEVYVTTMVDKKIMCMENWWNSKHCQRIEEGTRKSETKDKHHDEIARNYLAE
jgi:hypothetical protein